MPSDAPTLEQYVDVRALLPGYEEKECWNCEATWFKSNRLGESICPKCLWGQGDTDSVDEPTDYGTLWHGDVSREEMLERQNETRREIREKYRSTEVRL